MLQHDTEDSTKLRKKSGNPGYNIGAPIRGLHNISKEESTPKIWSGQEPSSLCRTSSLRDISFLEDTQSGCFLQLSRENFTNCEQLRNEIIRIQAELVEMELLIAKGGNYTNIYKTTPIYTAKDTNEHFVPMIFEDFSTIGDDNSTNNLV